MKKPAWRTVIAAVLLALAMLAALWICKDRGEFGAKMFDTAAWTLVLMLTVVGTKALGEHLAGGGGLKGALKALLTEEKPAPEVKPE